MKELIFCKLREIEQAESVHILYAVESGSRAWGFASPDSDYDVRFIYLRKTEDYLKIDRPRDVIEWQLDNELNINGWDTQKAMRLLRKSNPTFFEWANSPIVYQCVPAWKRMLPILNSYFSSKKGFDHYFNMAKGNYREYLQGEQVRIKKYLYVIRPILACKWILAHGTTPPVLFDELVKTQLEEELKPVIEALLENKKSSTELQLMPRIDVLNQYIERNLSELTTQSNLLSGTAERDNEELDRLFLKLLKEVNQNV